MTTTTTAAAEAGDQVVEDVEVVLALVLERHSGLLEQVFADLGAHHLAGPERELNVLAEARRVVVHERGGVAERLQQRVDLEDLELEARVAQAQVNEVLDEVLGRLGLARARFAADHAALRLEHARFQRLVGAVGERVDVRRGLLAACCCCTATRRVKRVSLNGYKNESQMYKTYINSVH